MRKLWKGAEEAIVEKAKVIQKPFLINCIEKVGKFTWKKNY